MSVKDTGPGVPEEEIPVVLASFGQGSNSIKSAEQGAGLGLRIARPHRSAWRDFYPKSKLRIGTEVRATFPPERVMSAVAPIPDGAAAPIQPQADTSPLSSPSDDTNRDRRACSALSGAIEPPVVEFGGKG